MGFLAPWFLAGMAAVALPLYLHLLRRSQHTPRPFSSLMFFERRLETTTRHRRLRYLSLLAARLALLILMALAFASPFINRTASAEHKRSMTVIAIDRSFSMRTADRMSQARAQAHRIVQALPGRQLAQVIAFDDRVENMTTPDYSHGTLDAAIDAVAPTDLDTSLGELVRSLRSLAQSRDTTLDVHLFSDLHLTAMPADFHDLALGDAATLHVHRIGAPVANWAVESVATAPRVYDVKRTLLTATIAGFETPAASVPVELLLDGKPLDRKPVNITANGRAEVEFRGFNVPYGQHRGELRITTADQLTPDNRFVFSVQRTDPRPVLFLYAHGRARQAFYYKAAFDSSPDTGLVIEAAPLEQVAGRDLSKYAFIVLHDPGALSKEIEQKLCGYVMGGAAALVAIGPDTALSGRIPLSKLSLSDSKEAQGAGFVDAQHAALRGTGHFENVGFFQTGRWKPGGPDRVLARLADDAPLLVEEPMGEGRVLQFATTLDNTASDFPLHASYLPFVAQTARYLAGGEEAHASYIAGSAILLRRGHESKTAADVTGPDGQRLLSLAAARGNNSFVADREGFYEVTRADGRRELIAAHADRRESDLSTISDETLELWRNTGSTSADHAGNSADRNAASRTEATETRPWSFWRYLLLAVMLAGVIEAAIARRYTEEAQRTA